MNDYQLMIKARNLIRRPKGWTRNTNERNRGNGFIAYCATGACAKVTKDIFPYSPVTRRDTYIRLESYLRNAMTNANGYAVVDYNDFKLHSQKQAIAWFQRAVRKAAKASGVKVTC